MAVTNWWELFPYGVKRYHYDKLICIIEFSERLAVDFLNNTFSDDTGTPLNNIPTLD